MTRSELAYKWLTTYIQEENVDFTNYCLLGDAALTPAVRAMWEALADDLAKSLKQFGVIPAPREFYDLPERDNRGL